MPRKLVVIAWIVVVSLVCLGPLNVAIVVMLSLGYSLEPSQSTVALLVGILAYAVLKLVDLKLDEGDE